MPPIEHRPPFSSHSQTAPARRICEEYGQVVVTAAKVQTLTAIDCGMRERFDPAIYGILQILTAALFSNNNHCRYRGESTNPHRHRLRNA